MSWQVSADLDIREVLSKGNGVVSGACHCRGWRFSASTQHIPAGWGAFLQMLRLPWERCSVKVSGIKEGRHEAVVA